MMGFGKYRVVHTEFFGSGSDWLNRVLFTSLYEMHPLIWWSSPGLEHNDVNRSSLAQAEVSPAQPSPFVFGPKFWPVQPFVSEN